MRQNKLIAAAIVLTLGGISVATTSVAQERVQGVLEACQGDISKFCEGVTPGNGHIIACMYAYEDQISENCSVAIVDFGDAIDNLFYTARQALAICGPDIETHCAETQIGGGRLISCLNEVASELTDDCKVVTAKFTEAFIAE